MVKPSSESTRIMASLKRILRAREITYSRLSRLIGMSEASVKRIFSRATLTLARLEQICEVIGISIQEVTRLSAEAADSPSEMLTIAQEKALAQDPRLLACFYLLSNGRSSTEIAAELALERPVLRQLLVRLAHLDLITQLPSGRLNSRAGAAIRWRSDGPVRKLYEQQVRSEFLQSEFAALYQVLHFRSAELSAASCRVLERKLERLSADFQDLADLDRSLPSAQKRSVGCMMAMRPWVFSMFGGLPKA